MTQNRNRGQYNNNCNNQDYNRNRSQYNNYNNNANRNRNNYNNRNNFNNDNNANNIYNNNYNNNDNFERFNGELRPNNNRPVPVTEQTNINQISDPQFNEQTITERLMQMANRWESAKNGGNNSKN